MPVGDKPAPEEKCGQEVHGGASAFALRMPPSEAAERIAVVSDCWLFTPRLRRNRMKRGKSRLIAMKNNIDRSAPTCRPQGATFYLLVLATNIGRRLRRRIRCSIGRRWIEEATQSENGRAFSLSCCSAIGEKAGRWREAAICRIGLHCSLLRDSSDWLIRLPPVAADLGSPRRDDRRPRRTRRFPAASPAHSNALSPASGTRAPCR